MEEREASAGSWKLPLLPFSSSLRDHIKNHCSSFLCSLHNIAADLAIEATSIFVTGIREAVGDVIFAKFLNMNSARSLALVIDVSGSMSGEF